MSAEAYDRHTGRYGTGVDPSRDYADACQKRVPGSAVDGRHLG